MQRTPFTSRSGGVLFWGASYLAVAIALSLALASVWPQGGACTTSCGARISSGFVTMGLLAAGGTVGLVLALWLGTTRRGTPPRLLVALLVVAAVGAYATALVMVQTAPPASDPAGLAAVRSAWSWGLAVPSSALLVTTLAAYVRCALLGRRVGRPALSARARRA
ncbi:MAG TPA: hypothetical protein VGF46_01260 [Gaiellales bacterium]|jgi:hypothetical protein